jgi:enoyl-CoA hydratase/carnithine racemase
MKIFETLLLKTVDDILIMTLNRPEAGNSLNTQMALDLREFWQELYVRAEDYRCVVITGSGNKIFCAGGDNKERKTMDTSAWQAQHAIGEQAFRHWINCPIPVIAAVNGAAYGGGCEMVLACDFAYAAPQARFALPEVSLGILPGGMGTQNLPRAVGLRRAKEVLLSAVPFSAEEALAWGVVNKICEGDTLMDRVLETARKIASNAPMAIRQAKKSMNVAFHSDLQTGYAYELEAYNRLVPTSDRVEGIAAWNEKRKPHYTGR